MAKSHMLALNVVKLSVLNVIYVDILGWFMKEKRIKELGSVQNVMKLLPKTEL